MFAIDGSRKLLETRTVDIDLAGDWRAAAAGVGAEIGRILLDAGAAELVAEARES